MKIISQIVDNMLDGVNFAIAEGMTPRHKTKDTTMNLKLSPMQNGLLNANGKVVTIDGERRKLQCSEVNGRFFCDAELLNPKTDEERKFCLMDLWQSESDLSARFLAAFAKLGGYEDEWTSMVEMKPIMTKLAVVNPNAGVTQPFPKGRWS